MGARTVDASTVTLSLEGVSLTTPGTRLLVINGDSFDDLRFEVFESPFGPAFGYGASVTGLGPYDEGPAFETDFSGLFAGAFQNIVWVQDDELGDPTSFAARLLSPFGQTPHFDTFGFLTLGAGGPWTAEGNDEPEPVRGLIGGVFDIPGGSPHAFYVDLTVNGDGSLDLHEAGYDTELFQPDTDSEVPEPGTLSLLALGCAGVIGLRHRRALQNARPLAQEP